MGKKQRNIIIVAVSVLGVLMIASLFPFLLQMVKIFEGNGFPKEATVITELNQPYEHNGLRITATDIKSINDPFSDKIIVGIKWEFENISNSDRYITESTNVTAYVDDSATDRAFDPYFDSILNSGNIAPGKRASAYYSVAASKDAKRIELCYKDDYWCNVNVTFAFDIPPVEG